MSEGGRVRFNGTTRRMCLTVMRTAHTRDGAAEPLSTHAIDGFRLTIVSQQNTFDNPHTTLLLDPYLSPYFVGVF